MKFDLVVNLTTVKAFGVTIPDKLLARADEMIEYVAVCAPKIESG